MKFTGKWMGLESITLSKVTQNLEEQYKTHSPSYVDPHL